MNNETSMVDRKGFNAMECKYSKNVENDNLDTIISWEDVGMVCEALDYLDARYRQIIIYHVFENVSLKDIAEMLNMNYGTVRNYFIKGFRLLKNIYLTLERGGMCIS